MEQVVLEKLRYEILKVLSNEYLIDDVTIATHINFMSDEIALRIRGMVWGEADNVQRHEIKYPADWRQAFRERWLPEWWLKRHPVKYIYEVIDVKAVYPNFRPKLSDHQSRLIVYPSRGTHAPHDCSAQ